MRYSFLICCLLTLANCVAVSNQSPQGTQPVTAPPVSEVPLSQQAAIDRAITLASQPQPEINRAHVPPHLVQAEQMTLATAFQRFLNSDTIGAGNDPNLTVWVITLEGIWTSGMPRPTEVPSPEPYRRYIVILNSATGDAMAIAARP
jgi:hypothetical protein